MHSATSKPLPCFLRLPTTKVTNPNHNKWVQFKPTNPNRTKSKSSLESLKYVRNSDSNLESSSSPYLQNTQNTPNLKLQSLASEFKSLPEPIDRVRRLLHYAALLPPLDESTRVESNRVRGCTTQVWLEVGMDSDGSMRFRIDSDSEITKGFCWCLVWVLDGAAPEEVAAVRAEDLADMNVGVYGKAHSRVNTWGNVLTSMKKRTRDLVEEKERVSVLEGFPALVVDVDGISGNGTYAGAQERLFSPGVAQLS